MTEPAYTAAQDAWIETAGAMCKSDGAKFDHEMYEGVLTAEARFGADRDHEVCVWLVSPTGNATLL